MNSEPSNTDIDSYNSQQTSEVSANELEELQVRTTVGAV